MQYFKIFFVILIFGFIIFSGANFKNSVLALTGNYSKNVGDPLSTNDWNKLDDDFVAKSGDTMQGDLNLNGKKITNLADPADNGDAVNKSSMDSAIAAILIGSGGIKNTSGESLKMICGSTPYGSTNWQNSVGSITLVVDTSVAGFASNDVVYFVSLYGDSAMYRAVGYNGIYDSTANSFRIYVNNNDITSPFSNVTARDSYKWYIKWCGIGK